MRFSVGIDLGGTNIKAGLVSESGKIIHDIITPTNADSGKKQSRLESVTQYASLLIKATILALICKILLESVLVLRAL